MYTDLGQPIMKVHRVLSCMHTTQFQIKLAIFCHIYTDFFLFSNLQTSKIWLQKPTPTGTVKLALEVSSKTKKIITYGKNWYLIDLNVHVPMKSSLLYESKRLLMFLAILQIVQRS